MRCEGVRVVEGGVLVSLWILVWVWVVGGLFCVGEGGGGLGCVWSCGVGDLWCGMCACFYEWFPYAFGYLGRVW